MKKSKLLQIGAGTALAGLIIGGALSLGGVSDAQQQVSVENKGDGIAEVTTTKTDTQEIALSDIELELIALQEEIDKTANYCSVRADQLQTAKDNIEIVINKAKDAGVKTPVKAEREAGDVIIRIN